MSNYYSESTAGSEMLIDYMRGKIVKLQAENAALRKMAEIAKDWECFDDNVGLRIEDDAADNQAQRAYSNFMRNLREALNAAEPSPYTAEDNDYQGREE